MLLRLMYDPKLAQASYLVGCQRTGEALVVDPNRDAKQYVAAAKAEGLVIKHVTETHIHADFLSGTRELARETGATAYLSGEGGNDWQYGWASDPNVTVVRDGDIIKVGNVRLTVVHTPGHTPEHVSFLLTDGANTDKPMGAFTGDFIFVGDVGRPDLLERAANVTGTMEAGARDLFRSLQRFAAQPDYLQVWPGHGAGSACGKSLGAVPSSTLGYERLANWAFAEKTEVGFVRAVLEGQPEPPPYFAHMKRLNRDGPPLLGGALPKPVMRASGELAAAIAAGHTVVDTRGTRAFAQSHVPGTINIPLSRSFPTYAGWVIPFGEAFYLIVDAERQGAAEEALRDLALIGMDTCAGVFTTAALAEWKGEKGTVPQTTARETAPKLASGEWAVLDVRGRSEWLEGHLPGVENIHYGRVGARAAALPTDRPLVLHCETGSRSAIAASVLRAKGFTNVVNMSGGYNAWTEAGLPVEHESGAAVG
jgi:hydroxyacylglutathione hydrolase